jgi:hypothetical protein
MSDIQVKGNNPAARRLITAITKRCAGGNTETISQNVKAEVKKINPALSGLKEFINQDDWFFDGKPIVAIPTQDTWEGEANQDGLPKDASLSLRLLEEQKAKCYDMWYNMLEDGLFDGTSSTTESKSDPTPDDTIDMAEVARRQKEAEAKKKQAVDEVVENKTESKPEPKPEPSPAPRPSLGTPKDVNGKLVSALSDFIASCDGPQEDSESLGNVIMRLDNLEAKLDELIDFRRSTEGNMKDQLRDVVGEIVREKMKGMFS